MISIDYTHLHRKIQVYATGSYEGIEGQNLDYNTANL